MENNPPDIANADAETLAALPDDINAAFIIGLQRLPDNGKHERMMALADVYNDRGEAESFELLLKWRTAAGLDGTDTK